MRTKALQQASEAQDTADSKRRVFVSTPQPPYDIGDLWTQGINGDIMRCQTARESGAYNSSDWVKASKYTDDTAVKQLDESLDPNEIFNRLTNNGEVKAIYKEGNQLFISFTYAKGGELVLGGSGDGNGVLRILSEENVEIGKINNNSFSFTDIATGRKVLIQQGIILLMLGDEICGRIGSFRWGNNPTDPEGTTYLTNKSYLGIGHLTESGTGVADIVINNGLNPDGYTEKIIFYRDLRMANTKIFSSGISNSGIFENNGNFNLGGVLKFPNGAYIGYYSESTGLYTSNNLRIGADFACNGKFITAINLANLLHLNFSNGGGIAPYFGSDRIYSKTGMRIAGDFACDGKFLTTITLQNSMGVKFGNGSSIGQVAGTSDLGCSNGWYVTGNLSCSGTKNRVVKTKNYGEVTHYCYETASPYFGDLGQGITNDSGECLVSIDDVFSETVDLGCEYQVFLQKEGKGDLWVESKNRNYFVVKGTPNLKFAWEIKAKQMNYSFDRLEKFKSTNFEQEPDYENMYLSEIQNYFNAEEVEIDEEINKFYVS